MWLSRCAARVSGGGAGTDHAATGFSAFGSVCARDAAFSASSASSATDCFHACTSASYGFQFARFAVIFCADSFTFVFSFVCASIWRRSAWRSELKPCVAFSRATSSAFASSRAFARASAWSFMRAISLPKVPKTSRLFVTESSNSTMRSEYSLICIFRSATLRSVSFSSSSTAFAFMRSSTDLISTISSALRFVSSSVAFSSCTSLYFSKRPSQSASICCTFASSSSFSVRRLSLSVAPSFNFEVMSSMAVWNLFSSSVLWVSLSASILSAASLRAFTSFCSVRHFSCILWCAALASVVSRFSLSFSFVAVSLFLFRRVSSRSSFFAAWMHCWKASRRAFSPPFRSRSTPTSLADTSVDVAPVSPCAAGEAWFFFPNSSSFLEIKSTADSSLSSAAAPAVFFFFFDDLTGFASSITRGLWPSSASSDARSACFFSSASASAPPCISAGTSAGCSAAGVAAGTSSISSTRDSSTSLMGSTRVSV
eukprot:Rhum_TRINITY_DN21381_c0_g1::Rhum_TRINITY_DN21381_c0_g1_i1::g.173911::m.173911